MDNPKYKEFINKIDKDLDNLYKHISNIDIKDIKKYGVEKTSKKRSTRIVISKSAITGEIKELLLSLLFRVESESYKIVFVDNELKSILNVSSLEFKNAMVKKQSYEDLLKNYSVDLEYIVNLLKDTILTNIFISELSVKLDK